MLDTITITSYTEEDPYSAFWAEVPGRRSGDVVAYFTGSDRWTATQDEPDRDKNPNSVTIERNGNPPLHFVTDDPSSADVAVERVEVLVARTPDSLV